MNTNDIAASRPKPRISKTVRDNLTAYCFIAPNFIGFLVITLIPLIFSLVLSLLSWDGANPVRFVGFENFIELAGDRTFRRAFVNTFTYTAATVPLTLVVALGLALLLNQKIKARNFFRTVSFFPYVASLVAVAAVWNFLFNPSFGPVNSALNAITGIPFEQLPRWGASRTWAIPTAVFFTIWKNMGYYMVIYLAGLQGVNQELYEAAAIDGANVWQRFLHVTIPQLSNVTFFVTMILIINSFKVYDIFITLFAGGDNQLGNSTRVMVYQIYNTAFRALRYGYASAMALVLFVVVLGVTLLQFYGEKKRATY
ncbi:MAG: sugar ABC transporter permease [Synergistaceae bacterium]|nr:sugar ABC transporter permease [Synergistaceae bacterium]